MPRVEQYIAEVTVSVVLRTVEAGEVARYSVVRAAAGASGEYLPAEKLVDVAESAFINATAGHHSLLHGVRNSEARRLK